MSTYELYIGGPPTNNAARSMFPAVPFVAANAPFARMKMAAHKGPIGFNDTRVLNFGTDRSLQEFLRNNAVAAADVLGLCIVPANMIFLGYYYRVENPVAGLTLTVATRNGGLMSKAIDCSTAAEGYVDPAGNTVTSGVLAITAAVFRNVPDVLNATVTAIGAAKFGSLKLTISPVLLATNTGGSP